MSLIPYVREFDRAFDRLFDTPTGWDGRPWNRLPKPPVEAYNDDDGLVVKLEVPGIPPEDLSVETQGRTLQIRLKSAPEGEAEAPAREYARAFTLPEDVDAERTEARCEHGVLTIRVPKAESAKPRRIEVKVH